MAVVAGDMETDCWLHFWRSGLATSEEVVFVGVATIDCV